MADTYVIQSQTESTEINPAGTGFEKMWNVRYRVIGGPGKDTVGTVTVTNENHNAAYLDEVIKAKINDINGIAALGG